MNTPRDPHLPPPEVCDWLLSQGWSGSIPEAVINYPKGHPEGVSGSVMLDHEATRAAIGADEIGQLFLPVEALEVLRADQAARRAAKEERMGDTQPQPEKLAPDEKLAYDIFRTVAASDLDVIPSIGVLAVAAVLMISQAYNLMQRTDNKAEVAP